MYNFLIGLFAAINLLLRLPVRIALKFNPKNEFLKKVDFIGFILAGLSMISLAVYGICTGEATVALCIAVIVLFGGIPLLYLLILGICKINDIKYMKKLYYQTNQKPDEDNYGYSRENPIWAGTCESYMKRLRTDTGGDITWEYSREIKLPKENGHNVLNGFYACHLYEISVSSENGKVLLYIVARSGLDKMKTWHSPRGFILI